MKNLIIICEGQTEEMFCDKILKPHFDALEITIQYPRILHSGGGIVPWRYLKHQIELHHASDNEVFITTFIDYYGMLLGHNFPDWVNAEIEPNKSVRMDILESGMNNDLDAAVQKKFIPNILLHEFETLILSHHPVFGVYYEAHEFNDAILAAICANDPETINNGVLSAPSKRLKANIRRYDKVNDGPELARLMGLNIIRTRCPRFNTWISKLENI